MAESRRKLDSKKYEKEAEVDEEAQKRRRIWFLVIFGIGAIAVVAGMFWLSSFLSGQ